MCLQAPADKEEGRVRGLADHLTAPHLCFQLQGRVGLSRSCAWGSGEGQGRSTAPSRTGFPSHKGFCLLSRLTL